VRWHRAGFRRYWRWKSRNPEGHPPISAELRALIRRMSIENVLWGAPHIHGELLKLGFAVAQSRRIVGAFAPHYNESRIHRSLGKDAPLHRAIDHLGVITSRPLLGALHHKYCRI